MCSSCEAVRVYTLSILFRFLLFLSLFFSFPLYLPVFFSSLCPHSHALTPSPHSLPSLTPLTLPSFPVLPPLFFPSLPLLIPFSQFSSPPFFLSLLLLPPHFPPFISPLATRGRSQVPYTARGSQKGVGGCEGGECRTEEEAGGSFSAKQGHPCSLCQ